MQRLTLRRKLNNGMTSQKWYFSSLQRRPIFLNVVSFCKSYIFYLDNNLHILSGYLNFNQKSICHITSSLPQLDSCAKNCHQLYNYLSVLFIFRTIQKYLKCVPCKRTDEHFYLDINLVVLLQENN